MQPTFFLDVVRATYQ